MRHTFNFIWLMPILLLCVAGCATSRLMSDVGAIEIDEPHLVGAIHNDPAQPSRATGVVIEYVLDVKNTKHHYDLEVPLTNDGSPIAPFGYYGRGRTAGEIACDLSASQRSAVERYRFTRRAVSNARRAMRSAHYTSFPADSSFGVAMPEGSMVVFGVHFDGSRAYVDDHFPTDCKILILPRSQPRPAGERVLTLTAAIMLAPFTLTFDLITLPAQYWYGTHVKD